MELQEAINSLEKWVKNDRELRDNKPPESDYDHFCENVNIAIERIIEETGNAYELGFDDGANAAATDILNNI